METRDKIVLDESIFDTFRAIATNDNSEKAVYFIENVLKYAYMGIGLNPKYPEFYLAKAIIDKDNPLDNSKDNSKDNKKYN